MYKRRLQILMVCICLGLLVLLGRLGVLQLLRGDHYRAEAERALQSVQLLPGARGLIVDRNGVILAEDQACHQLSLDYGFIVHSIATDRRWLGRRLQRYWDEHGGEVDPVAFERFKRDVMETQAMAETLDEQLHWAQRSIRQMRRELDLDTDTARERFERQFARGRGLAQEVAGEFGVNLDAAMERLLRKYERWSRHADRPVREQWQSHVVISGLDEDTANSLRPLLQETVGMGIEPGHRRYYPHGAIACHIIGLTTPVYQEDAERHNLEPDEAPWLERMLTNYLAGDVIGKTGVEAMYEAAETHGKRTPVLRARRGYRRFSRPGETELTVPAEAGQTVRLTIDIELQARLTSLLARSGYGGYSSGSIVVIDVPTGEVLALVSWPVFDLNTYDDHRLELETDAIRLPMLHRAVAAAYAPGSTVKPITALAGLGAGKITPDTEFNCSGYMYVDANGKKHHRCWNRTGHGPLNMVEALRQSCNVYFHKVASQLGAPLLTYWMGLFGFGEQPGTGLPGEKAGVLATANWLHAHRGRGYLPSDKWFFSIGQGVFAATPLQVANAHAAIARKGTYISPRIIKAIEPGDAASGHIQPPAQETLELPIPAEHVEAVQRGMYEVVNDRRGTAWKHWNVGLPLSVEACGKTGTAQVPPMRIDSNGDGRLTDDDQIVRQGNHAWFAGFAPYREPKIAFAVLMEYAGSGGENAAPIAKETVRACIEAGYLGPQEGASDGR
jgi:penicillin-binding protein 2